ncbi:MAG: L-seryl-tRNA(Sec) selenium transferase [Candidatus Omnitrophica bacterium]|nr:L-seryl-tRNA(Sec) selenium transferase [Candidatus Omnitrophota bacterium]
MKALLSQIPSVSEILELNAVRELGREFGDGAVKVEMRGLLDEWRRGIRAGEILCIPAKDEMVDALRQRLVRLTTPQGRAAINAAGILLHTGLGRSPLCAQALEALAGMGTYSVLQTGLASGKRSLREEKIERMLIDLTGCEAATIVNNNAAATMLVLHALAGGKEVIISRGQLIEIGGEFRMPDVMAQSQVVMREVGTTNRTHLHDYERAINENTGALIHVHTSNFRVRGFTGVPDIGRLCALGKARGLPVIDDIGSGSLIPLSTFGLADEPLVRASIQAGADVVCFSGDKLIGGPQSGIICGKKEIIERIRKNPFARMFRVCKLTVAALEATLLHFVNGTCTQALPFYQMLSVDMTTLNKRAVAMLKVLDGLSGIKAVITEDVSYVGSGSLPDEGIPTVVVRVSVDGAMESRVEKVAEKLRVGMPSVFCRINDDALFFDMRTLFAGEEIAAASRLREVLGETGS